MPMTTTCPACHTRFRVSPGQLSAHRGDVRCGRCAKVFNAHAYLEHEPEPFESEGAANVAEEESPRIESMETAAAEELPAPLQTEAPIAEEGGTSAEMPGPAPSAFPQQNLETPTELPQSPILLLTKFPEPAEPVPAEDAAPVAEISSFEEFSASPAISLPEEVEPADEFPEEDSGLPLEAEPETPAEAPAEDLIAPVAGTSHPKWRHERPAAVGEKKTPAKRSFFWLWLAGSLLLLMSLGMQGVYFFRSELAARQPGLKPLLQQFCGALQCKIRLPANPDFLSIETSNLEADPVQANLVTLNAILRNRARLAQEYPLLELALTDTQDKMIARRIFQPREYAKNADLDRGMLPNEEVTVKLALDLGDLKASGYRVFLFYPQ